MTALPVLIVTSYFLYDRREYFVNLGRGVIND